MKRTPLRRHPKAKKPRRVRPGVTPKQPKGWKALIPLVIERDGERCRQCGEARQPWAKRHLDHTIPRRLFASGEDASELSNLALLCERCHGRKTHEIEPRLYRGDVLRFELWLQILSQTGPVPSSAMLARAYKTLRRLTNGTIA